MIDWIFDPAPPSGARKGGLANAQVFDPEIDSFVREVESWSTTCETIGATRVTASLPPVPDDPEAVATAVARLGAELNAELGTSRRVLDDERAVLQGERDGHAAERRRAHCA